MAKAGFGTVRELLGWSPDEALTLDQQGTLRGLYYYQVAQDVWRSIWDDSEDKRLEALPKKRE